MSRVIYERTKTLCPRCADWSQSPNKPAAGETCSLCLGEGWAWELGLLPRREARFVNRLVEAFAK